MATREAANLVPTNGEPKTSGKAWGRVGKFLTGKTAYPVGIFFIVGNEFCERFSYYGMRTILVVYLIDWLKFSGNTASSIYHAFVVLCYMTPLLGAILADGYIGKFKTILYLSIIYALGNVLLAVTSFPPPYWLGPIVALLLIGFGTGGIKPCVSAFGGDQFPSDATKQIAGFFSIFYFAINLGSLLSTVLTPLIRANVFCFGTSCFPLAFGIPAMLMIISLILFIAGRSMYKRYPPTGNVIGQMIKAICRAVSRSCCGRSGESREHWLDHAEDKYEPEFLADVKCVLRVLVLFIPLPVFWALFDQQALNPILIISFIPLFDAVIYPLLDKCRVPNSPLQRMVSGMSLSVVSFVVAGLLQIYVTKTLDASPASGQSSAYLINTSPCDIAINTSQSYHTLSPLQAGDKVTMESGNVSINLATTVPGGNCGLLADISIDVVFEEKKAYVVAVQEVSGRLQVFYYPVPTRKPKTGSALIGVLSVSDVSSNQLVSFKGVKGQQSLTFSDLDPNVLSEFKEILPKSYTVHYGEKIGNVRFHNGGVYLVLITSNTSNPNQLMSQQFTLVPKYTVSVLWQIPQYVIITAAEILFSISGLNFAYSQAPVSMKSVLQASWLMTVAGGNMLDMIITGVGFIRDQAVEFFVFAALMALTTIVFGIMAYFYKYTNHKRAYEMTSDEAELDTVAMTTNGRDEYEGSGKQE